MLVKGKKGLPKDIRSILLVQLGDIGDVVWTTPTFRAVKEAYPRSKICVLLREGGGSLLAADPYIHKVFEIERCTKPIKKMVAQVKLVRVLRQECFDLAFDLRLDDRGAFMSFLSGAPVRASLFYRKALWRNTLFTHIIAPALPKKRIRGAAEQSLRVVREFDIDTDDIIPKIWVSEEIKGRAKKLLDGSGINVAGLWVTLNPFSRWKYKEWQYDKWVHIVDWLWEKYGIPTVVVGAPEDREASTGIVRKCKGQIKDVTGKTTLGELAGVLSFSSLHLGVDSAAPHIAAAVGAPTITVYGPTDWRDWAPHGKIHSVVTPDYACAPCYKKGCNGRGKSKCLDTLPVDKVKTAVERFCDKAKLAVDKDI